MYSFVSIAVFLQTEPHRLREYQVVQEVGGLQTAVLGLSFTTSRQHFQLGVMRFKCVARIATVYFQSQETSVAEADTRPPHTIAEGRRHFLLGETHTASGKTTSFSHMSSSVMQELTSALSHLYLSLI